MAFFGFEQVEDFVKTKRVQDLFARVTNSYDLMNDMMSLGIHRFWKDYFVKNLELRENEKILDAASGTGDIAQAIIKRFGFLNVSLTASDLTESMLLEGKRKAVDAGIISNINYVTADAEKLPFEDESFDVYTIAFGMRNIGNMDHALHEAFRVLRKGGRFYCMEFSKVQNPLFENAYNFYSDYVIPTLGKYVARDESAYQYLVDSIRTFPSQSEFADKIAKAGFSEVRFENLTNGIVAIHQGVKN